MNRQHKATTAARSDIMAILRRRSCGRRGVRFTTVLGRRGAEMFRRRPCHKPTFPIWPEPGTDPGSFGHPSYHGTPSRRCLHGFLASASHFRLPQYVTLLTTVFASACAFDGALLADWAGFVGDLAALGFAVFRAIGLDSLGVLGFLAFFAFSCFRVAAASLHSGSKYLGTSSSPSWRVLHNPTSTE